MSRRPLPRRRLIAAGATTALLTGVLGVVTAAPASAATNYTCQTGVLVGTVQGLFTFSGSSCGSAVDLGGTYYIRVNGTLTKLPANTTQQGADISCSVATQAVGTVEGSLCSLT